MWRPDSMWVSFWQASLRLETCNGVEVIFVVTCIQRSLQSIGLHGSGLQWNHVVPQEEVHRIYLNFRYKLAQSCSLVHAHVLYCTAVVQSAETVPCSWYHRIRPMKLAASSWKCRWGKREWCMGATAEYSTMFCQVRRYHNSRILACGLLLSVLRQVGNCLSPGMCPIL